MLASQTRPGAVRILDPMVSKKLLMVGDEVSPPQAESEPARHLHQLLKLSLQDNSDDDSTLGSDSDGGNVSDPEETIAQEERLERRVSVLRKKKGLGADETLKQVCCARTIGSSRTFEL